MHPFGEALAARDLPAAVALLAEDVVLHSPVVFKPYHGRDAAAAILYGVSQVFEDFRYVRAIGGPADADHALVFNARIGDREIEGCDLLHVDEAGQVEELTVMVRPLSGAQALLQGMRAQLEASHQRP